MRLAFVVCASSACSSSSSSSSGAHRFAIDSTEFPFTTPLGPEVKPVWTMPANADFGCFTLTGDDASVVTDVRAFPVKFRKRDRSGKELWSTPVTFSDAMHGFEGKCSREGNLQVFAMTTALDGSIFAVGQVHAFGSSPDGSQKFGASLIDATGKLVWAKTLDDRELNVRMITVLADPTGDFLVTASLTAVASGSLDGTEEAIFRVSKDGAVKQKVKVDALHVPEYEHPGAPPMGSVTAIPLGIADPLFEGIAPTKDGGFVVVGTYNWGRSIACGTDADPQDPSSPDDRCPQQGREGALLRYDAGMKLLWTRHYGDGYFTSLDLAHVAELGDGSFIATGSLVAGNPQQPDPPIEALAMGIDGDGNMRWVKSHPWGKRPGATFTKGGVAFEDVVATTSTDADVVMSPPTGDACLLVRIHEDGSITHVQTLTEPQKLFGAVGRCWGVRGASSFLVRGEQTFFRFDPIP